MVRDRARRRRRRRDPVEHARHAPIRAGAHLVRTTGGTVGTEPASTQPTAVAEVTRALLDYEIADIGQAIRAYGIANNVRQRCWPAESPASALEHWSSTCLGHKAAYETASLSHFPSSRTPSTSSVEGDHRPTAPETPRRHRSGRLGRERSWRRQQPQVTRRPRLRPDLARIRRCPFSSRWLRGRLSGGIAGMPCCPRVPLGQDRGSSEFASPDKAPAERSANAWPAVSHPVCIGALKFRAGRAGGDDLHARRTSFGRWLLGTARGMGGHAQQLPRWG